MLGHADLGDDGALHARLRRAPARALLRRAPARPAARAELATSRARPCAASAWATFAAASRSSRPCSSSSPSAARIAIVSRCGEPLRSAITASRRTASLSSRVDELVQERPHRVDHARMVARKRLEREDRRAAAGRALVVEAAPQELDLLAEAELRDRAVGDGALAEVLRPRGGLELVVPCERSSAAPARRPLRRARRPAPRPRRASRGAGSARAGPT